MGTITLENVRATSDITVKARLKDGGVAIDWSSLTDIKAWLFSDAQKAIAGRFEVSVDQEDGTVLVCTYSARKPQYLGVNRLIVQAKYLGRMKTYDKPCLNLVPRTADVSGTAVVLEDPIVEVSIEVTDVSSSIMDTVIAAAVQAAERAEAAAEAAEHMVDIHTGPEGKSAYEVAVEEGYTGTEEEWLASLKGPVGETPDITIGTVTTVEPGTPAAATMTGTPEAPVLNLSIPKGLVGSTPNLTVGTVTTGEPGTPVVVTITGTAEAPVLNIQIPQGMQGNTGSSVAYPFELVNNLTTDDATKALSAAQGKVLDGKVTELEAKVTDLQDGETVLQQQIDAIHPVVIEGNVTNAPDNEDITADPDNRLKFADRPATLTNKGYKILRTDKTFASQVTDINTIYEIRYQFDINGGEVTIPTGCELRFVGGSIVDNAETKGELILQNTLLSGDVKIGLAVVVTGTASNDFVTPKMFGATGDGVTEDTNAFVSAIAVSNFVKVEDGTYLVNCPETYLSDRQDLIKDGIVIKKSNFTMTFSENSKLTTILPLDEANQVMRAVITITGTRKNSTQTEQRIENIRIVGANIEGGRSKFNIPQSSPGDTKENYIGIVVSSANNVEITDCTITDNTGDAVFTIGADNVIVKGLVSKRNRRAMVSFGTGNGCAVLDSSSELDCVYVEYPNGNSSYGTSPRGIICTEDDSYGQAFGKTIQNVTIKGNHFIAPGAGTFVVLGPFDGLLLEDNLIDNATINNNLVTTTNGVRTISRSVVIRNNTIKCASGYESSVSQYAFYLRGAKLISGNRVEGYGFATLYTTGDIVVDSNLHSGLKFINISNAGDTLSCNIVIKDNVSSANNVFNAFSASLSHKHNCRIENNTFSGDYPRYDDTYMINISNIWENIDIVGNIIESRTYCNMAIQKGKSLVGVGGLLVKGNTIRMLQGGPSYPFNGTPSLCDGIFDGNYFEFAGSCSKASVGDFTGKMVFTNNVMNKQMTVDTTSNANLVYVNNTII